MREMIRSLASERLLFKYRAYKAYWRGEKELRLLKKLVDPNKGAIDVGANLGEYAFWLEKICQEVILFEPHPDCVSYLKKCIRPSTRLYQIGLSNDTCDSFLSVPIDSSSNAVTCRASLAEKAVSDFEEIDKLEVSLAKLDDFECENIGFIKIDVEGHELKVLQGAEDTLKRCSPALQVEIEQRHLDTPIEDVIDHINSLGYRGYFYRAGELTEVSEFDAMRDQLEILKNDSDANSLLGDGYVNNFIFLSRTQQEGGL